MVEFAVPKIFLAQSTRKSVIAKAAMENSTSEMISVYGGAPPYPKWTCQYKDTNVGALPIECLKYQSPKWKRPHTMLKKLAANPKGKNITVT